MTARRKTEVAIDASQLKDRLLMMAVMAVRDGDDMDLSLFEDELSRVELPVMDKLEVRFRLTIKELLEMQKAILDNGDLGSWDMPGGFKEQVRAALAIASDPNNRP